ncbi:MAG: endolytic transglycosylase MltG [Alphaproteobacteria bacterium]|nr:endolytic transglycosylase MltG [Alphaproteobacteria bacterium]
MRSKIVTFFLTLSLASLGCVIILWAPGGALAPGPNNQDVTILIEKGSGLTATADALVSQGVVKYPWGFVAAVIFADKKGALKAGEYLIPAQARPIDIAHILASGKVIVHQVTIPEGLTVTQIIKIVKDVDNLSGEIIRIPEEGALLPETYSYVRGESREKVLSHMRRAMTQALKEVWGSRSADFPLKSPEDLLVLASIIEKETGVAAERPRVAAVFLNRLKKGMKLQSDPTVIYGLTRGEKPLGRLLTLNDLKHVSDYNTYVIPALPPKPIACPGLKSLQSVVSPAKTPDVYFVADGTGGHAFSATYDQHLQNVKEWRKVQKTD